MQLNDMMANLEANATIPGFIDAKGLAETLDLEPSTIRIKKMRGQLPETTKRVGNANLWSIDELRTHFERSASTPNRFELAHSNPNAPTAVDLFAGCGGLSLGFQRAGINVEAGFDNWQPAVDTYNLNLDHEAHRLDLGDVQTTIEALAPIMPGIDGIIGGPPCQDFSSAGKRKEGDRADLTEKFADIVKHFKPRFFVMENVERAKISRAFGRAVETMRSAGYGITPIVLDASKCGVPQRRKRLITVGFLESNHDDEFRPFIESHLAPTSMTMREYFGENINFEHYYRHPRSYARRGVFSIDEPSPTIRGVNRPIPSGYPGHPGDTAPIQSVRTLTTRERASIQTFPDDFQFAGARTTQEQMIGNAVPVGLAEFVGNSVRGWIELHGRPEN